MTRTRTVSALPLTTNKYLIRWVEKIAELTQPSAIHWVDGSEVEYNRLCQHLVDAGTFTELNKDLWPGCFYARSDAKDVARVEERTYICSLSKETAGPTNNWEDPFAMRKKLKQIFKGCMRGRTIVRNALQYGSYWIAHVAAWRSTDGLGICGCEHAHYGAHGAACLRRDR